MDFDLADEEAAALLRELDGFIHRIRRRRANRLRPDLGADRLQGLDTLSR